jgi:hypothetical protein
VALGILVTGFAAAFLIYLNATPPTDRLGERPEDSKQYLRQMEVYGGTANVLAGEARKWFEGLWHGRALAFTVACLSVLLAVVAFIALTPLPARIDETLGGHGEEGGPDSRGARGSATSAATDGDAKGR